MTAILALIFFGLGLIIGSFLNVVIFRLNTNRSFAGRSACMSCQKKLSWYELIPVLSFLCLRGRCLRCKTKISSQYPVIELVTGVVFAALYLKLEGAFFLTPFAFVAAYAFYAAMFSLLIVVAVYDIKHKIIPDSLAFLLGALAFAGMFFFNIDDARLFYPHLPTLWQFLSGFILAAPFALLWLVSSGRWMGLGDAKLAVGLGWLLGPSRLLSGAVLSFWVGAILGIILVAFSRKYKMNSELPFAPYLVLGALLAFLFELHIILFNL
ncbi:MAG: Type 4 prepilin-like protein leader peptide-processing enzyme PilD [Parcubacteria group bacterium GW2011_GWA1_47_10]|uniref:Type 4 prepilin-like protein leader peptide-processing enzyme PilD n=1 Tax=Candidatus Nomurabacteria bacterium GW2011_GWB1_47_6 TaxID=1618749 RepID=A0A0G1VB62_9BACT|nr:MAG: Type 4 prepilin-like protein leader peptide-processing enzyme PilD [Parcubacteria group bacterium GW2011_GWA1_47_10]KKU75428.1 MAG: Type 4 prepilin-like protein leader peptide-processing enzyme PilD [Candidatus Nomurabacteria bacterium GW2011_GWB1_47_6]